MSRQERAEKVFQLGGNRVSGAWHGKGRHRLTGPRVGVLTLPSTDTEAEAPLHVCKMLAYPLYGTLAHVPRRPSPSAIW